MYCYKCGTQLEEGTAFCHVCGAAQNANMSQPNPQPANEPQSPPMKWFKFMIYFALWVGALSQLGSGFGLLTGTAYMGMADQMYSRYYGLEGLSILVGIASLAMAALLIYTRFRLAGFYVNGPKMLLISYGVNVAIQLVYTVGLFVVLADDASQLLNWTDLIGNVVPSLVMLGINKNYFDKREHLFKNY